MADLVFRQVVAVIDKRTSVVCLHAAGQIQPPSQPFETLAGRYENPPFHAHCRSLVVPWMPGFVNSQRATANAELKTRSFLTRQKADGRVVVKIPRPSGWFASKGPGATVTRSPGRGFQSVMGNDEVVGLIRTGKIDPIADLAGDYDLKEIIDALPERYAVAGNGGGLSETYWVTDNVTGRRYSLKYGSRNDGSLVEVVTSEIQQRMGFEASRTVFADGIGGIQWTLTEHIEDVLGGVVRRADDLSPATREAIARLSKTGRRRPTGGRPIPAADRPRRPAARVAGSGRPPAGMEKAARRLAREDDVMDVVVQDWLTDQTDRKAGNWLRIDLGREGERWIPIDADGTFLGHMGLGKQDLTLGTRAAFDTIEEYVKKTGTPPRGFVQALNAVDVDDVVRRYDELTALAGKVDVRDIVEEYRGVSRELDDRLDEIVDLWEARLVKMTSSRSANLRYLTGGRWADETADVAAPAFRPTSRLGRTAVLDEDAADRFARGSALPEEFWHGSRYADDIVADGFDFGALGRSTNNGGMMGAGAYVTESKAVAEAYATGPNQLLRLRANVQNPVDMDSKTFQDAYRLASSLRGELEVGSGFGVGPDVQYLLDGVGGKDALLDAVRDERWTAEEMLRLLLKGQGHDAAVARAGGRIQELVVFDPENLVVVR